MILGSSRIVAYSDQVAQKINVSYNYGVSFSQYPIPSGWVFDSRGMLKYIDAVNGVFIAQMYNSAGGYYRWLITWNAGTNWTVLELGFDLSPVFGKDYVMNLDGSFIYIVYYGYQYQTIMVYPSGSTSGKTWSPLLPDGYLIIPYTGYTGYTLSEMSNPFLKGIGLYLTFISADGKTSKLGSYDYNTNTVTIFGHIDYHAIASIMTNETGEIVKWGDRISFDSGITFTEIGLIGAVFVSGKWMLGKDIVWQDPTSPFKRIGYVQNYFYNDAFGNTLKMGTITYPNIVISSNLGNSAIEKKIQRIRINSENHNPGQVFEVEVFDKDGNVLYDLIDNDSYGLNQSTRRFVAKITPEKDDSLINQISLTYDDSMPENKRG